MELFQIIAMFLYGSIVGSFLNVCIFRIPKYESIVFNRSHCPDCNHLIGMLDNIPLISFIFLGGKCRYCKKAISPQYFCVELLTALMFVVFFMNFGISIQLLKGLVLGCLMIIIFFIDLKYQLIFDRLTFSGVIMGLLFSFILKSPGIKDSILGIIAGYMFFVFIFWLGIILLFFSDFIKELSGLFKNLFSSFKFNIKSIIVYFRDLIFWIIKMWDAICIPIFLSFIIAFSLFFISLLDLSFNYHFYVNSFVCNVLFCIFFCFLFFIFFGGIIKDILREKIYDENLRRSNQISPFVFSAVLGYTGFIGGIVFWEDYEELPPIGGGDAKFGALIGAFLGWKSALISFVLAIIIGAFIGIIVIPIRFFQSKYRFGKTAIPFGPAMVLSVFVLIFYQNQIISYYNSFIDWYIYTIINYL